MASTWNANERRACTVQVSLAEFYERSVASEKRARRRLRLLQQQMGTRVSSLESLPHFVESEPVSFHRHQSHTPAANMQQARAHNPTSTAALEGASSDALVRAAGTRRADPRDGRAVCCHPARVSAAVSRCTVCARAGGVAVPGVPARGLCSPRAATNTPGVLRRRRVACCGHRPDSAAHGVQEDLLSHVLVPAAAAGGASDRRACARDVVPRRGTLLCARHPGLSHKGPRQALGAGHAAGVLCARTGAAQPLVRRHRTVLLLPQGAARPVCAAAAGTRAEEKRLAGRTASSSPNCHARARGNKRVHITRLVRPVCPRRRLHASTQHRHSTSPQTQAIKPHDATPKQDCHRVCTECAKASMQRGTPLPQRCRHSAKHWVLLPCTRACCCGKHCAYQRKGCSCADRCGTDCPCYQHMLECDPDLCSHVHQSGNCGNMGYQCHARKRTVVGISTTEGAGFGLFMAEPCAKGEFIMAYAGELVCGGTASSNTPRTPPPQQQEKNRSQQWRPCKDGSMLDSTARRCSTYAKSAGSTLVTRFARHSFLSQLELGA